MTFGTARDLSLQVVGKACLPYVRASAHLMFRVALRQDQAAVVGSGECAAVAAREETPPVDGAIAIGIGYDR
jgi:hypothetical protein